MMMMMMMMVTWREELPEDCRKSQPRGRRGLRTPPVYQLGQLGCHHYVGQCDVYDFVHSYQGLRCGIFTNFIVNRLVLSLALILVLCLTSAEGDRICLQSRRISLVVVLSLELCPCLGTTNLGMRSGSGKHWI